jgi:hypothetical protein
MKAINTLYAGNYFRSRTEARWAVFFDALGVRWEYEKEGYDLGNGVYYLPDFWFPDYKMYGEVKGSDKWSNEDDVKLCKLAQQSLLPVFIFVGTPKGARHILYEWDENSNGLGFYNKECVAIPFGSKLFGREKYDPYIWDCPDPHYDNVDPRSLWGRALYAAQTARFEHGKTPL